MSPETRQVLAQVAPFLIGVAILGVLMAVRPETRVRIAWKPVPLGTLVRWLVLWVVWVTATELLGEALGRPSPARWTLNGPALGLKILGIVVLAPLLEEWVFRGLLFQLLLARAGAGPAVVGTAVLFALAHGQYRPPDLVFVFLDGLLLGLARLRTGSTRVPAWMHLLGNAFAAWQRLRPW
ncbi:MAG: CPBP family intramembrane glutamic endopeptidase [Myxococcaceae bacterium]